MVKPRSKRRQSRLTKSKRAIAVKQLILITLALCIAFVVARPTIRMMLGTTDSLSSLGPSECTDLDKTRKISEFKDLIKLYSQETQEGGSVNDRYSPIDAKNMFKKYIACKQTGMFKKEELSAHDLEIMAIGKAVYIKRATELCNEIKSVTATASKQEIKDLYKEHGELAEEYDFMFDQKFSDSSAC